MAEKYIHPDEYIASLPEERQPVMQALRRVFLENLPKGFEEEMAYGMICYSVPHSIYPKGYHCDPKQKLPFLSLASQKSHIAVYHMALYEGSLLDWFLDRWAKEFPKKPDMGKSCIRFKKPEQVPIELLGELASKMTPEEWIERYEKAFTKK